MGQEWDLIGVGMDGSGKIVVMERTGMEFRWDGSVKGVGWE